MLALFIAFEVVITNGRLNGVAAMFWWRTENAIRSRKGSKYVQGPKMNTPDFHTGVLYTPHVERTELASCAVCDAGIKEQTAYTAGDVRNDGRYHLKSCHGTADIRYKTWTPSFKSMY